MAQKSNKIRYSDRAIALTMVGVVAGMLGLSFASVPLYRIFCQVTGYGGTTQRAEMGAGKVLAKTIVVRFDSNVAKDLPWRFKPVQRTVKVKIGETTLVHYRAQNLSDKPVVGTASFNVTPEIAGSYFSKIECFCFTEQLLNPGQDIDMPVQFFIDPEMVNDVSARGIEEITLSYTFFPKRGEGEGIAGKNVTPGGIPAQALGTAGKQS